MIQKRSKMTIILDILPVKIHVLTAIAAENKASAYWSRHGQCRRPPPPPSAKKNTRQERDASILLPRGYRNLVSQVPLPMTDNDEEDALQN